MVKVNATGLPLLPAYTDVKVLLDGLKVAAPVFGFAPDPLSASIVPLPELTFTFTEPLFAPTAVGFDVTVTVQLAPAANVPFVPVGQLFVSPNGPLTVIDESVIAAPDLLASVAVCDALVLPIVVAAKVRESGVNSREPTVPVPESTAVCGLLAASSVNVSGSLFAPLEVGLKMSETVHDAPAATCPPEVGQLPPDATAKSAPVVIELIVAATAWLFWKVTVFVPELAPTATFPQLSVVGESVIGGVAFPVAFVAVPLR